jgi:hypothetical protein
MAPRALVVPKVDRDLALVLEELELSLQAERLLQAPVE